MEGIKGIISIQMKNFRVFLPLLLFACGYIFFLIGPFNQSWFAGWKLLRAVCSGGVEWESLRAAFRLAIVLYGLALPVAVAGSLLKRSKVSVLLQLLATLLPLCLIVQLLFWSKALYFILSILLLLASAVWLVVDLRHITTGGAPNRTPHPVGEKGRLSSILFPLLLFAAGYVLFLCFDVAYHTTGWDYVNDRCGYWEHLVVSFKFEVVFFVGAVPVMVAGVLSGAGKTGAVLLRSLAGLMALWLVVETLYWGWKALGQNVIPSVTLSALALLASVVWSLSDWWQRDLKPLAKGAPFPPTGVTAFWVFVAMAVFAVVGLVWLEPKYGIYCSPKDTPQAVCSVLSFAFSIAGLWLLKSLAGRVRPEVKRWLQPFALYLLAYLGVFVALRTNDHGFLWYASFNADFTDYLPLALLFGTAIFAYLYFCRDKHLPSHVKWSGGLLIVGSLSVVGAILVVPIAFALLLPEFIQPDGGNGTADMQ